MKMRAYHPQSIKHAQTQIKISTSGSGINIVVNKSSKFKMSLIQFLIDKAIDITAEVVKLSG